MRDRNKKGKRTGLGNDKRRDDDRASRYKIRKEKSGAYIFDSVDGKVKFIPEDAFTSLEPAIGCRIIRPKTPPESLPADCFSAPSKVYLELTRKCTLRCKYCYNAAGEALSQELSTEEVFKVLEDLAEAGTFEIRLTGGEPTTRRDFFDIIEYANGLGFFVSIGTNGVWSDETLKRIAASPIRMVIISLDGDEEVNDAARGERSFRSATNSLEYLAKNTDKILRINMTMTRQNVDQLDFIVALADRHNIPVINTMPIRLNGRAGAKMRENALTPEEYLTFIKNIERLRKTCKVSIQTYFDILGEKSRWLENQTSLVNKSTCAAGVEACIISPAGDVYGCAASNASDPSMDPAVKKMLIAGNVKSESIIDIWLNSSRWKAYRDLAQNKSKRCLSCRFYTKKCFGNCFISSFFGGGRLNADDPYCFAHILENKEQCQEVGKNG